MTTPSPLQGGARRRRRAPRLLVAAIAAALVAAVVALLGGSASERAGSRALDEPPASLREPGDFAARFDTAPGIDLGGVDAFALDFHDPPRAGLVFDLDTGEVLWRRHPVAVRPVASLTKIMSALVVVRHTRPHERVLITREALAYRGSGVGVLPRGKRVPIRALMHGMLLPSGNDAAIALAVHVAGSERAFVRLMNRRARRLGLRCTRFVSPHGYERGNRSCAADLAALTRIAMAEPRIARVARKPSAAVRFPIKGRRLFVNSTNPLLRERFRGTIGLKTGYTRWAGRCFVAVVRRGARTFGVVLLHSPSTANHAKKLVLAAARVR